MKTVVTILYTPPDATREELLDLPEVAMELGAVDQIPAVGDTVTFRSESGVQEYKVVERIFAYGSFGGNPERAVKVYVTSVAGA